MVPLIDMVFKVREMVETAPIQILIVAVPLAMAALAAISAAVVRLVEDWVTSEH